MMNVPSRKIGQITVIGDSDAIKEALSLAEDVGAAIAHAGFAVITGGRGGIMEAANKGAFNAGGLSIGILPSEFVQHANRFCHIVIPTGLGHARNAITALACDAIVAIGGGAGTLSEISFGWIYEKPIFAFEQFEGWAKNMAGKTIDSRRKDQIQVCKSVDDLTLKLEKLSNM